MLFRSVYPWSFSSVARGGGTLSAAVLAIVLIGACRRSPRHDSPPASASAVPSASGFTPESNLPEADLPEVLSADQPRYQVGEKASAPDYKIAVKTVKECKYRHYYRPNASHMWLGVELWLEGASAKEVRVNPFFATLKDANGHVYRPTLAACEPELPRARLSQGDHAHGWITFEIPRAASGLVLRYDPLVIGAGKEPMSFAVLR